MACMDQRQARNPTNNATTLLGGLMQMDSGSLNLNPAQNATIQRLSLALATCDTYNTVIGQNSAALQASSKLWQLFSPPLPDNRWQTELRGWFETGLASLQRAVVDFVENTWMNDDDPSGFSQYATVQSPSSFPAEVRQQLEEQAHSQIVRSVAGYQSFITLGVGIIVVVSVSLMLTALLLSLCMHRRWRQDDGLHHRAEADIVYGKFHLGRLALEGQGYRKWSNLEDDVPIRVDGGKDIGPPCSHRERLTFRAKDSVVTEGNNVDPEEDSVGPEEDGVELQELHRPSG